MFIIFGKVFDIIDIIKIQFDVPLMALFQGIHIYLATRYSYCSSRMIHKKNTLGKNEEWEIREKRGRPDIKSALRGVMKCPHGH